ncbi:hypothetical protein B5M09_010883 [Aphanomyces astaci]|uniref:Transposase Tc1-like domain-containing protein n=1 Tax=Aphanomyces astaci TaxID=112090 RepID=A0A3R7Y387_APHAT|nr:hypothetical protein B5M09_010883 [Aphanomyces astaci]
MTLVQMLYGDVDVSFEKLEGYFATVVEHNPGTFAKVEKSGSYFYRSILIPQFCISAAKLSIRCQAGRATVRKIWRDFKSGSKASKKKGRVGPKPRHSPAEVTEIVRSVPARDRSTMHDMASSTGISVSTLCRQLKSGTINRRSSRLKPLLTDTNKIERLAFCRDHVNIQLDVMNDYLSSRARDAAGAVESREPAESPGTAEFDFSDMWDVVHLDEKWFNADKDCRKTYLTRREVHERRACKSKRFIPKVKFLAAVARPRLDEGFDGKLVEKTPARRNSRNRPAGTLVTALVNVDGKTYRDYVITKVVPSIKERFPSRSKRVVL